MPDGAHEVDLVKGVIDPTHPHYKDRPVTAEAAQQKRRDETRRSKATYDEKLRGLHRRVPELPRKFEKLDLSAARELLESAYARVLGDPTLMPSEVAKFELQLVDKITLLHNSQRDDELWAMAKEIRARLEDRMRPNEREDIIAEPIVVQRALPREA